MSPPPTAGGSKDEGAFDCRAPPSALYLLHAGVKAMPVERLPEGWRALRSWDRPPNDGAEAPPGRESVGGSKTQADARTGTLRKSLERESSVALPSLAS